MHWKGDFKPRDKAIHPPALHTPYKTTVARSPRLPLVPLSAGLAELSGPVFGHADLDPRDADLLANGRVDGDVIGERIVVHGRVLDENGRPVPNSLIEVWQANAGGRYRHVNDGYLAPLDPNFTGGGRCLTDEEGYYIFRTIRPGPYPWPNDQNSWRPAHIHFSLFGEAFAQRLVTQMYFEGDPLLPLCPIFNSVPDADARRRLVAPLDMDAAEPFDYLAYRFDIVLRGRKATVFENKLEG
jgi:protocatechuate 3,4-dioxygenase beta subunit